MAKILIQFAHPLLEKSRVQAAMLRQAKQIAGITVNDLYEHYPDFDIDVRREQELLLAHDIIILQHPFYWYSSPAIVKQWMDLVLEHGWAYGSKGTMLRGKWMLNAISCGGSQQAYQPEGRNRFTIRQMLAPMEQTARLCQLAYVPPFVVFGTHRLQQPDIDLYALQYGQVLAALQADRISPEEFNALDIINRIAPISPLIQS